MTAILRLPVISAGEEGSNVAKSFAQARIGKEFYCEATRHSSRSSKRLKKLTNESLG
jgi:hypothetical protein